MDESRAFESLGLPQTATEDEINARFRELSLMMHPDKGGPTEEMQELTQAHRLAVAVARNRALVPVSVLRDVMELARTSQELAAENQRALMEWQRTAKLGDQAQKTVENIIWHHTSRPKSLQRMATLSSAIAVAIGFLLNQLFPSLTNIPILPDALTVSMPVLSLLLILLGAGFAVNAWMFNERASRIQGHISEVNDALDDNATYLAVFDQVVAQIAEPDHLTKTQLEEAAAQWALTSGDSKSNPGRILPLGSAEFVQFSYLVKDIGPADFVRMLVAKGLAKGFLQEVQIVMDGHRSISYKVVHGTS
jgi:hypothetical protein